MKFFKKGVAAAVALLMATACFAGCGSSNAIDGTATVAVCDGEDIPMGVVALYTRLQQGQTYSSFSMYASALGTTEILDMVIDDETGLTYGEEIRQNAMVDLRSYYTLRAHAEDYGVTVSEDELAAITEAAAAFMEANDADALKKTGISQADVENLLSLYTYQTKMYPLMIADVDTEVSDEEAAQAKVTYVRISLAGTTDEEGNTVELTEDEIQAKKDQAEAVLEKVMDAGAEGDMDALAKEVDETFAASSVTYSPDAPTLDDAVVTAVEGLEDGTVVDSVITSSDEASLYVVRFDTALDREATDAEKATIIATRQEEDYTTEIESWLEAGTFEIKEDVWKTLKVNDTQIYTIITDDMLTE